MPNRAPADPVLERKTLYRNPQNKFCLSGGSITDTGYVVGFESVTYCGQRFKEPCGMMPPELTAQRITS